MKHISCIILLATIFLATSSKLVAQVDPTPTVATPQRTWTVADLLKDKPRRPAKKVRYCQSGRWKPCVCWQDVAREVRYRPSLAECNGNAAIVTTGKYHSLFSVVVRDTENRDRFPIEGINNCSVEERDTLGLNKCSAFKTQESFAIGTNDSESIVNCLGASGYSTLFKRVVRITAKLSDAPTSNTDPVVRWCLRSPSLALN